MDQFKYKPIDLSKNAIRVVRLCRGYYTDDIRCELFEAYLDELEGIPYEALSYTWGDQSNKATISLDGKQALVTSNLFAALSCIRLANEDKLLWVDALCIDQKNDLEQGHQVARMKLVYEHAERVIIWLGPSNDNIDLLMDSALELGKRGRETGINSWSNVWEKMEIRRMRFDNDFGDRRLAGLLEMLKRAWFRRVWIIQEVAAANRATLRCGWKTIPSKVFPLIPKLMEQAVDPHVQAVLDVMPGPSRRKEDSWWSRDHNLMSLLAKFRNSESKDPRDCVYALLGISSDFCDNTVISPDYELPLDEMIRNVVWALLFKEPLDRSIYKLPSWDQAQFLNSVNDIYGTVLDWAISENELPVLVRLEKRRRQVGFQGRIPLNSLIKARATTDVIREFIIRANPDVNKVDEDGQTPLNLAVSRQRMSVFKLLLDHEHIDVNQENRNGNTPLITAAASGKIHLFESLTQRSEIHINHEDFKGDSPLNIAVMRRNASDVEVLLKHINININHIGSKGQTPLFSAWSRHHLTILNLLLQHKDLEAPHFSEPDLKLLRQASCSGDKIALSALMAVHWSPLSGSLAAEHKVTEALVQASAAGHLPAIRMLLEKRTPIDKRHFVTGIRGIRGLNRSLAIVPQTPLGAAIAYGHKEAVDLLLQKHAMVNTADRDGATPLWLAVKADKKEITQLLLSYGADINKTNANGQTPLCCAAYYGNSRLTNFLLDSGAEINEVGPGGHTPLCSAVSSSRDYETISSLLNRGADMSRTCWNAHEFTHLDCAVKANRLDVIQLLLSHGADINHMNLDGGTPLINALRSKDNALVQFLLENGPGVNCVVPPAHAQATFWAAITAGNSNVVELCLKQGVDIESREGPFGRTPLSYSVRSSAGDRVRDLKIVRLLLEAGAKVDMEDIWMMSSFHS